MLEREGDLTLVLLTLNGRVADSPESLAGSEAAPVLDAVRELVDEGWQVVGRLHTAFVGYDAEDHFWRETYLRLGLPFEPGWRK